MHFILFISKEKNYFLGMFNEDFFKKKSYFIPCKSCISNPVISIEL